jgi:cysteine-rich repeat protein
LALACAAFAFAGCGPEQTNTGGIEATLTLDADAVEKHFTQIGVAIVCHGIDPITGLPWPTEIFAVNLSTSEGNDPTDPKDSLGLFKKEGLPEGNCDILIGGPSDDHTMHCGGFMADIPVVAGPDNTFVTIVINCITEARYGGIGATGEFNQCMEYSQITVSPTTQSVGNDIDVDIWCYDPDSDDGHAYILFLTAASLAANPGNPSLWQECGPVSTSPAFPCDHQDPPTDPLTPSASETVTCNVSNENCLIIVAVSDDFFAAAFTDPFGCGGQDDNANAVIPVYCQGFAVCGDDVIEFPEECDPPSGASANPDGDWCDSQCKLFDPCDNPEAPPASCPAPADPLCQSGECSVDGVGNITCGVSNAPNGTPCGGVDVCQDGACVDCGSSCTVCGDGVLEPGEQCDDGNTVNGDGCDDWCFWETQQAILNVCCNAPVIGQVDAATTYDYLPLTTVQQGQLAQIELAGVVDLSSIGLPVDLVVINPSDVSITGTAGTASSDTFPIPTPQSVNPATQPLVSTGIHTMDVAVDPAATQVCLDISSVLVNVDLGLAVACTSGTCGGTPNTPICVPVSP